MINNRLQRRLAYASREPWNLADSSRSTILCATGAETVTAQHRPARLWFERDAIGLAALIANNLELFTFRSPSLSRSAKVLAPRITAGFATLRMA